MRAVRPSPPPTPTTAPEGACVVSAATASSWPKVTEFLVITNGLPSCKSAYITYGDTSYGATNGGANLCVIQLKPTTPGLHVSTITLHDPMHGYDQFYAFTWWQQDQCPDSVPCTLCYDMVAWWVCWNPWLYWIFIALVTFISLYICYFLIQCFGGVAYIYNTCRSWKVDDSAAKKRLEQLERERAAIARAASRNVIHEEESVGLLRSGSSKDAVQHPNGIVQVIFMNPKPMYLISDADGTSPFGAWLRTNEDPIDSARRNAAIEFKDFDFTGEYAPGKNYNDLPFIKTGTGQNAVYKAVLHVSKLPETNLGWEWIDAPS